MRERQRRFLVSEAPALAGLVPAVIMQGYLLEQDGFVVRVRRTSVPVVDGEEFGTITVKGPRSTLGARDEEELVFNDTQLAGQILKRCRWKLLKRRYSLPDGWILDVFDWDNGGLILAELEQRPDGPDVGKAEPPAWVTREVTREPVFNNEWLARRPWGKWSHAERGFWLS